MPHQALQLLKVIYKSELENNEISENDLAFYLLNPHPNNSENGRGGGRADLEAKLGAETNPIKSLLGIDPKTLSPEERDWLLSMHVVLKGDNGVYSYSHSRKNRRKPYVSLTLMQLWLLLEHQVFFHQFSVPFRAGVSQNLDRAHCGTWINTVSLLSELNNIDASHIEIIPPIREFPSQHYWSLVDSSRLSFSTHKSYGRFSGALNKAWKDAQKISENIPYVCFSAVPFNDNDKKDIENICEIFKELGFTFTMNQFEYQLKNLQNAQPKANLIRVANALCFFQELNVIFEKSDFIATKAKLPDYDKNANGGEVYTTNHQAVDFYKMCSAANMMLKDEGEQLEALKTYLSIMPNNTIVPCYSTKALLKAAREIRTWFEEDAKKEFLAAIEGEKIQATTRNVVVVDPVAPDNSKNAAANNDNINVVVKKVLTQSDIQNLLAQLPTIQHSYFYRLVFKQTITEVLAQHLRVLSKKLNKNQALSANHELFLKSMLDEVLARKFNGERIPALVETVFKELVGSENMKNYKQDYINLFKHNDFSEKMSAWINECNNHHSMMKTGLPQPKDYVDFIAARHQNKILTREVIKAHLAMHHDIADTNCSFFRGFKSH